MRSTTKLMLLSLAMCGFAAHAQREEDAAYGMAYVMALTFPESAKVCSEHIPGYREPFDAAFSDWKEKNKDLIARGELLMNDPNDKENLTIKRRAAEAAAQFARQPVNQIISQCETYLRVLRTK